MFTTNDCASFHLCLTENLVKHQKVSKYYESSCLKNFLLPFMFLLIAPINKNGQI